MQFLFYEIVARIVAIYLCVDCCRRIGNGLVERKIAYTLNGDFLDWLLFDSSRWVANRDNHPGQVLDTNRPPDHRPGRMPRCCDTRVVASDHLSPGALKRKA